MNNIFVLKAPQGANRKKKVLGRGHGAGTGKTSGRGHKGQNSRSGGNVRPGFEGGQMPLYRRVAARGFSNYMFKKTAVPVNLFLLEKNYSDGEIVSMKTLLEKGLIKKSEKSIKILGNGELSKKLDVQIEKVSAGAVEKIEKAGGKVVKNPNQE
ncbi:50S ribosomal protein L15 [Oceanispirochaeta sp.]|jgi:large subunit ribosomal protein L15|uniref:50S ribosomal protein L15 n=1 Tax=Oceanispirochaeta sp. TaxID=2035350 RepID=UPI00260225CB|nr:50S ribosomal protein L15 [Oceanispirochaeta sp.]MDA3958477.1 50S ribosomal protein L15 [Oceanispirochaeta sp.]